ncbi:hypothetical protein DES45_10581 [Microvirga subterranea]|uniref:Uncharacterized protein n=2 Tax=Microvirga subterranea TaxID=186651 RepID=A0A370HJ40_9HYPH|nr:hypothetical protein DES45_10581 [Microvirga subterranea]
MPKATTSSNQLAKRSYMIDAKPKFDLRLGRRYAPRNLLRHLELAHQRMEMRISFLITAIVALVTAIALWGGYYYSTSTDFALHYALVEYIGSHGAWPDGSVQRLEVMSTYPAVTHTLAAVASKVTGSFIYGTATTALISVLISYLFILYAVRFEDLISTFLVCTIFIALIYFIDKYHVVVGGEISGNNFYFAQMVSLAIVIPIMQVMFSGRISPIKLAVLAVGTTFALGWVYPMATMQFACGTIAYFGVVALQTLVDHRTSRKDISRSFLLLFGISVAIPLAVVLHPTFADMSANAAHEGGINLNLPATFVPKILLVCGLVITGLSFAHIIGKLNVANPVALTATALGIFGAAFVQLFAFGVGVGSLYGVAKHVFPVVTITLAILAMLMVAPLAARLRRTSGRYVGARGATLSLAAFFAFAASMSDAGRPLDPILRSQEFLSTNLPADAARQSASMNKDLLPMENFAISLGDLHYDKVASAVRALGPAVVGGSETANRILAGQPIKYAALGLKTSPQPPQECVVAQSLEASTAIVKDTCLEDNTIYRMGEWISVANLREDRPFLRQGWSNQEHWGIWNDGSSATLTLKLEKPSTSALRLEANVIGYISKEVPQQTVEILAGELKVGEWTFTESERSGSRQIVVPPSAATSEKIEIRFNFPNATSPSGATRRLAMGLIGFRITEVKSN